MRASEQIDQLAEGVDPVADEVVAGLAKLRNEFPAGTVGILPKPYKKDSPKGKCDVCGGYHGLPAAHLDFVGHAAVTDRLLNVDPYWTWDFAATDEQGNPALDREGNLWIRLTVLGVTRLGVGDGHSMKERIGDAIRNAAMRFGVALSLWTKDELESGHGEAKATTAQGGSANGNGTSRQGTVRRAPSRTPEADPQTGEIQEPDVPTATPDQVTEIKRLAKECQMSGKDLHVVVDAHLGRTTNGLNDLTVPEATSVIQHLENVLAPARQPADLLPSEEPF